MTTTNPITEAVGIANELADRLEKDSQPGDRWPALAARRLVEVLASIDVTEPDSSVTLHRYRRGEGAADTDAAQLAPNALADSDFDALAKQAHALMLAVGDDMFGPVDSVRALSCYDSLTGEQRAEVLRRVREL